MQSRKNNKIEFVTALLKIQYTTYVYTHDNRWFQPRSPVLLYTAIFVEKCWTFVHTVRGPARSPAVRTRLWSLPRTTVPDLVRACHPPGQPTFFSTPVAPFCRDRLLLTGDNNDDDIERRYKSKYNAYCIANKKYGQNCVLLWFLCYLGNLVPSVLQLFITIVLAPLAD